MPKRVSVLPHLLMKDMISGIRSQQAELACVKKSNPHWQVLQHEMTIDPKRTVLFSIHGKLHSIYVGREESLPILGMISKLFMPFFSVCSKKIG